MKYRKLSQETRWLLAILLEQYEFVDEEVVEVKDMCKAWDGAMQMYADEARAATRKEMKKEMKKEMRRQARETRCISVPVSSFHINLKDFKRHCRI